MMSWFVVVGVVDEMINPAVGALLFRSLLHF